VLHRSRRRVVLTAAAATGIAGLAGCGGGDAPRTTGACREAVDGEVTLVAEAIAWDTSCLEAVNGEPLTIVVDNRDDGVNHNVRLGDAPGEPHTELEAGPVIQRLEVTLDPGEYEFICDIHPNMVGTLRMVEANPTDP
jgi:plastocyanin